MQRTQAGISLVEILTVVTIAAILLGMAIPSFTQSTARKRIEGAAAELATDLQYAKSQAASLNTSVSLVTAAHAYSISGTSQIKANTLNSAITLTNPVTVTFEPHRTMPSAAVTMDVSHSQTTATLRVAVNAVGVVSTCSPSGTVPGYSAC